MAVIDRVRGALDPTGILNPQRPLVVGVSGGPDSLCLLDCLHRLGLLLVVAHYDHQLRPDSSADAARVGRIAADRGLPYELAAGDVAEYARTERLSIEEAARSLRYRFLFDTARRVGAQAVAVGHTADDQVETVLMHLLRGAGLAGLKGMLPFSVLDAWDTDIPLLRPLLGVWRSEIETYCEENGLQPLIDATNQQTTFFRNRLRHELVPELQRYNPQAKEILLRTAEVLAGDWVVLEQAADAAWQDVLLPAQPGGCALDRPKFERLPVGLKRAVFRRMLAALRPRLRDIDFETVERGLAFSEHPSRSREMDLAQGLRLRWEPGRLTLTDAEAAQSDERWPMLEPGTQLLLDCPGSLDLPGGWTLRVEFCDPPGEYRSLSVWEAWLDAGTLSFPLEVRASRPGERFQPFGLQGRSQKLSDFWINAHLPRAARADWPLVYSGDQIVWVPGYRIADGVRVKETSLRVAHLQMAHAPV